MHVYYSSTSIFQMDGYVDFYCFLPVSAAPHMIVDGGLLIGRDPVLHTASIVGCEVVLLSSES